MSDRVRRWAKSVQLEICPKKWLTGGFSAVFAKYLANNDRHDEFVYKYCYRKLHGKQACRTSKNSSLHIRGAKGQNVVKSFRPHNIMRGLNFFLFSRQLL